MNPVDDDRRNSAPRRSPPKSRSRRARPRRDARFEQLGRALVDHCATSSTVHRVAALERPAGSTSDQAVGDAVDDQDALDRGAALPESWSRP